MSAIGVIDYGMGNLHSLAKALERSAGSQRVLVTYDPDKLAKCERLVLPGVGGVRACMAELQRRRFLRMLERPGSPTCHECGLVPALQLCPTCRRPLCGTCAHHDCAV